MCFGFVVVMCWRLFVISCGCNVFFVCFLLLYVYIFVCVCVLCLQLLVTWPSTPLTLATGKNLQRSHIWLSYISSFHEKYPLTYIIHILFCTFITFIIFLSISLLVVVVVLICIALP